MTLQILRSICCDATVRPDDEGCAVCNRCNQRTYYKPRTRPVQFGL